MHLPTDLVKIIKLYLNSKNILVFDKCINYFNNLDYGYPLCDAKDIVNRYNSNFKHKELGANFDVSEMKMIDFGDYYSIIFVICLDKVLDKITDLVVVDFLKCLYGGVVSDGLEAEEIKQINIILDKYKFDYFITTYYYSYKIIKRLNL
jgi:hypothetical protein